MRIAGIFLFLPFLAFGEDILRGKEIVLGRGDGNCLLCHAIPGADRPAGNIGPSLAGVGSRLTGKEIRERIVDASRFNPDSVMPPTAAAKDCTAWRRSTAASPSSHRARSTMRSPTC